MGEGSPLFFVTAIEGGFGPLTSLLLYGIAFDCFLRITGFGESVKRIKGVGEN